MCFRMRQSERLTEDMCPLEVEESLIEIIFSISFDCRPHLPVVGLSQLCVHIRPWNLIVSRCSYHILS